MENNQRLDPFGEPYPPNCPPFEEWSDNHSPHEAYIFGYCESEDCELENKQIYSGVLRFFEYAWLCPVCYIDEKNRTLEEIAYRNAFYSWVEFKSCSFQEYKVRVHELMVKFGFPSSRCTSISNNSERGE